MDLAFDNNDAAISSYNRNSPHPVATKVDLFQTPPERIVELVEERVGEEGVKGIIGGPPCQTFSKGNVSEKVDESKHSLPKKYAEILHRLNDRFELDFFVFENVRGITYTKHRASFSQFKIEFERAGFRLFEGLLDAVDFGVPQFRPRVFVVGLSLAKYGDLEFTFPSSSNKKTTVRDSIAGIPEPIYFRKGLTPNEIPLHANHWTMKPHSTKFTNGSLVEGCAKGRSFRVLAWDKPSWTVAYGNREIHIHPTGRRRLSIYEAMRLQGFSDEYQLLGNLSEQVRQVSDAIPPVIGEALGVALTKTLQAPAGW